MEGFQEVVDQAAEATTLNPKPKQARPIPGKDAGEGLATSALPFDAPPAPAEKEAATSAVALEAGSDVADPAELVPLDEVSASDNKIPPEREDEESPREDTDQTLQTVPLIPAAVLPVEPIEPLAHGSVTTAPEEVADEIPDETTRSGVDESGTAAPQDPVRVSAPPPGPIATNSMTPSDAGQHNSRPPESASEIVRTSPEPPAPMSARAPERNSGDGRRAGSELANATAPAKGPSPHTADRMATAPTKDQVDLRQARVIPPGQADSKAAGDLSFAARIVADERLAKAPPVAHTGADRAPRAVFEQVPVRNAVGTVGEASGALDSDQQTPAEKAPQSLSADLERAVESGSGSADSRAKLERRSPDPTGPMRPESTHDRPHQDSGSLADTKLAATDAHPQASLAGKESARGTETPRPPAPPMPPELNKPTAQTARRVHLRLDAPDAGRVDVHVMERGGKLDVAVRTPEAGLASSLRHELGGLMSHMHHQGMRAEAWAPEDRFSTGPRHTGPEAFHSADSGTGSEPDHRGSQQQSQRDSQQRPQWIQQLDDETDPDMNFSQEVIDWLRTSTR